MLSTRPLKNKTSVGCATSVRTRYTERAAMVRGERGTEMEFEWPTGATNAALPIGALTNRPQAG